MQIKKKSKHNYTSELELTSLLIRIKNERNSTGTKDLNAKINRYVKLHTDLSSMKYSDSTMTQKKNAIRHKLKDRIISMSEKTTVDSDSYERFGEIILLMIKNILRKPQFSGYTYKDDFYSDAVYKILKYLHNFDHTKISEISGQNVKAFAYISQYIHNSIIYIINTKKKESDRIKKQIQIENISYDIPMNNFELINDNVYFDDRINESSKEINIDILKIDDSLVQELKRIKSKYKIPINTRLNITYPSEYRISFDEYDELKSVLSSNISITRQEDEDDI